MRLPGPDIPKMEDRVTSMRHVWINKWLTRLWLNRPRAGIIDLPLMPKRTTSG